jgi:hypothetical protein
LGETCSIRVEIISGNPGTHALISRDLGHYASSAQVLPVGRRVMDNAADCLPVKPVACHTPGPYREVIIEICVDLHKNMSSAFAAQAAYCGTVLFMVLLYIQGGQMKSGQILSHIYSKTNLNIIFKFYTLVTEYISCLRCQSQHNGYKFRISGRGYVDGG